MTTHLTAFLFWLAVGLLAYVYAGFPLLLFVVGRLRGRRVRRQPVTPSMSLIIVAYNEEAEIGARLENALSLDYPPSQLEIFVASDGSTDATEAIVSTYAPRGVQLLSLPRRGKIHALNAAAAQARGEVLVFSDANAKFEPQALLKLARNFADVQVGGVAGHSSYAVPSQGESSGHGEKLYWNYDTWLKQLESLTGSIVSAHGAIYAIRRELFRRVTDASVTDDFAISTAVVEQGRRLVFEPEARAWEATVRESQQEFRRRVRLMSRGFRAVLLRRHLLNPFRFGFYSLILFTHKVLRRLLPLALIVLFAASLWLGFRQRFYSLATLTQVVFYSLAAAGLGLRRQRAGRARIFYVPFYFCMSNTASLVGLYNLLTGERIELWQPQRHAAPSEARVSG